MEIRASICALVDQEGEVEKAELWLAQHQQVLSFVSAMNGCGCCVFSWDIQGPREVVETLPESLSMGSEWASSKPT